MKSTAKPLTAFVALVACFLTGVAGAAEPFSVHTALRDTEQYFTAPLRWDLEDWAFVGVTAAAVAAAHQYDSSTRTHFATGSRAVLDGKDPNSVRDALPAVALVGGTWLVAGLIGDRDGYRETWSLLEAGVLSSASGEIFKLAAGRARPNETLSPNDWRHGGSSFPSVHSSAAFAVGMVFAESGNDEYRWVRRVIGYGIAAGTSYIRVRDNVHWVSDTVAGAALGIATARFVLNRQTDADRPMVRFEPSKDGWVASYTIAFR